MDRSRWAKQPPVALPKTDAQATLISTAATYDPLFKLGFGLTY
jgi:hypothetical protein